MQIIYPITPAHVNDMFLNCWRGKDCVFVQLPKLDLSKQPPPTWIAPTDSFEKICSDIDKMIEIIRDGRLAEICHYPKLDPAPRTTETLH
jgi:hypothetical protein